MYTLTDNPEIILCTMTKTLSNMPYVRLLTTAKQILGKKFFMKIKAQQQDGNC